MLTVYVTFTDLTCVKEIFMAIISSAWDRGD